MTFCPTSMVLVAVSSEFASIWIVVSVPSVGTAAMASAREA